MARADRSFIHVPGMPEDVVEEIAQHCESRADRISDILRNATDEQLRRIRVVIGGHLGKYGWYTATESIKEALRSFDRQEFNNPVIAQWLRDQDLQIALSNQEFRLDRDGYVTTKPPKKKWDYGNGGYYWD
jgi:hypothetical protein